MDLIVIGEHNIRVDSLMEMAGQLPSRLQKHLDDKTLGDFCKTASIQTSQNSWEVEFEENNFGSLEEQVNEDNLVAIQGPCDLTLYFGPKSFTIFTKISWPAFIESTELQSVVKKITEKIVKSVDGRTCIYIADTATKSSMYDQYIMKGYSIQQIKEQMEKEIGPPADRLSEIAKINTGPVLYDGYLIEEV